MASETKVILTVIIDAIAKSKTVEEAYDTVAKAARVEGLEVLSYDDAVKQLEEKRNK